MMGRLRIALALLALAAVGGVVAACTGAGEEKNGATAAPGSADAVAVLDDPALVSRDGQVGIAEGASEPAAAAPAEPAPPPDAISKPLDLTGIAPNDPRVI